MNRTEAIEAFVAAAKADIGVGEKPRGSNRGPRVEAMLAITGLDGGYPWCAAAVSTWGHAALGKKWPLPLSADCDALLSAARRLGILKSSPKRGDVFLRLASQHDANHTGIMTSDDGGTIEGNTNDGGSRDGYGVFARKRSGSQYVYIRWADAVDFSEPWKVVIPSGPWPSQKTRSGDEERPYVPARAFVAALTKTSLEEAAVTWDNGLVVNGKPVPSVMVDGSAWGAVRDIAEALGSLVSVNGRMVAVSQSDAAPKREL